MSAKITVYLLQDIAQRIGDMQPDFEKNGTTEIMINDSDRKYGDHAVGLFHGQKVPVVSTFMQVFDNLESDGTSAGTYNHEDPEVVVVSDVALLRQMRQLTLQMNLFGYYIFVRNRNVQYRQNVLHSCSTGCRSMARRCLVITGVIFTSLNVALFGLNAFVWYHVCQELGLLALLPVNIVITSMKLVHNGLHFISFMVLGKQFESCNHMVLNVAASFSKLFVTKFNIQRILLRNWVIVGAVGFIGLVTRISRLVVDKYSVGTDPLMDSSIILSPLLLIWQILPLLYFYCISYIILQLVRSLRIHLTQQTEPLQFYYSPFLTFRRLVRKWNQVIDCFVIYSMLLSILVLCMAIYYMVRAEDAFRIDPNMTYHEKVMNYYSFWWCGVQITIALLYILVLCSIGGEINCGIKSLMAPVLERASADQDERYVQKLFLESIKDETLYFGIWRTIPFHRALFFKVGGVLMTYSVLMMRLKDARGLDTTDVNSTISVL